MNNIKDLFNHKRDYDEKNKIKFERVIYDDDDAQLKRMLSNLLRNNYDFDSGRVFYSKYPRNQRVTFKLHLGKSIQSHNKYINNYMIQSDKNEVDIKPVLFGTDLDEYNEKIVKKHFKCIISPENQNVNLETLVRDFIKKIERITGYELCWQAAIHKDTNHKHAHVCINGIDRNGKDVYFQRDYIKKTFREMLSNSCTNMIGQRSEQEIRESRKNLYLSKRFTELDERLKNMDQDLFRIKKLPQELQNRILFLADLKLAEKLETDIYKLKYNWEEVLTAGGRFNSYLDEYIKDNKIKLYSGKSVSGKVIKVIDFDKEESWNDALIIQTEKDEKIYVPVYQLMKEELENKDVFIKGKMNGLSLQIKDSDIKVLNNKDINNITR